VVVLIVFVGILSLICIYLLFKLLFGNSSETESFFIVSALGLSLIIILLALIDWYFGGL